MYSAVIVNYKLEKLTRTFLKEELLKLSDSLDCIVIVNNAATEESNNFFTKEIGATIVEKVYHGQSKIVLIPSTENLGFAKANNIGSLFIDQNIHSEYILFTNNDIHINNKDILSKMSNKMVENNKIGMIGPKVIGLQGELQSPEPYSNMWDRYVWVVFSSLFISKEKRKKLFKIDYANHAQEGFHYKIMGCFFMVRTSDFIKCGMMDEKTFLYAEETILTERMKKIGKLPYYFPSVSVIHEQGKTTNTFLRLFKRRIIQFNSDAYFYHRYRNVSAWQIMIIKIIHIVFLIIIEIKHLCKHPHKT